MRTITKLFKSAYSLVASCLLHHNKCSADQFFLSEKRATHAPFPLPIDKLMVEWTKPVVVSRTVV